MKYNEYLESARRHSYACRLIRDRANDFSDEDRNEENFKYLVCSLYYLSGYIIECSLKFKIFECCGFDSEIDIDDEECVKVGINYRKKIKTHSFNKLQEYLESKVSGVTHESDDIKIVALLDNWNPEIRYETRDLDFDLVKSFYEHANNFLRVM